MPILIIHEAVIKGEFSGCALFMSSGITLTLNKLSIMMFSRSLGELFPEEEKINRHTADDVSGKLLPVAVNKRF